MPFASIDEETPGAESTPAESSTATEGSPASSSPDGAGTGAGPEQTAGVNGKPQGESQDSLDAKLPFSAHPRWKEVYGNHKNFEKSKPVLDALGTKGIHDLKDAEYLLGQLDQARERIQGIERQQREDPIRFAQDWKQSSPESYGKFALALVQTALMGHVDQLLRAGQQDKAKVLQEVLGVYSGGAAPRGNPSDPRNADLQRREQAFNAREQESFMDRARDGVHTALDKRIDGYLTGIKFLSDEQRQYFLDDVYRDVRQATDEDPVFQGQLQDLLNSTNPYSPQTLQQRVQMHEQRAIKGGLLERAIAKNLNLRGLQAGQREQNRQATLDAASQRREPGSAGGAATGEGVTREQERQMIDGLKKRGYSGAELTKRIFTEKARMRGLE